MNSPDLSIVIPTFNRKQPLSILLNQFKGQKITGIEYKIVVVVDGSTDGTLEMLSSEFPDVHVVKGSGNWWFTKSMNEGCKYAVEVLKSRLILTINDDVQVSENYLLNIINNYNDCGKDSVIGSSSYSATEPHMITFSGIKWENRFKLKYHKYIPSFTYKNPGELKGVRPSVTLPTRGVLISSEMMKKVNYLDEVTFPQYSSDYDFILRAAKKGAKVYVSYDAYLFENMQMTSGGNPRLAKNFRSYLNNIFFNKYSSNYFFNQTTMVWRHGIKLLFPYYLLILIAVIPYVYIKYKYSSLNNKVKGKN